MWQGVPSPLLWSRFLAFLIALAPLSLPDTEAAASFPGSRWHQHGASSFLRPAGWTMQGAQTTAAVAQ